MVKYHSGSTNQNCTAALRYAALGYKVYPVWGIRDGKCLCGGLKGCRPGKHPYGKAVPHGEKDATTDAETLRRWFRGDGVNVGISIDGFCVLDPDCHSADANGIETLAEWERRYENLPLTPTVKTGGGGRHYYFKPLGMSLKPKEQVGVGVELLTSGGVIAPPSLHELGGRYEWLTPLETPLADMPQWLINLIRKDAETPKPKTAESKSFDPMRFVVGGTTFADLGRLNAGERNDAVNSVIGSMLANGFTPEQVLTDGLHWAEWQEPPYSADDMREKVRWCSAKSHIEIDDLPIRPIQEGEVVQPLTVRRSPFAGTVESETPPHPVSPPDAYYGVLGDFVKAIEPHTEADALGILACLLAGVGNALGRGVHHLIGRRHAANLFVLLVGDTTDRKGTCWDIAEELLSLAAPAWAGACLENGFGSGQGVVWRIRDANGDDEGTADKRLMVAEEEFGKPLKLAKSENSILAATMREAFDGKPLSIMNKGENRYGCRSPHVSVIGMITPAELHALVKGNTSVKDGFLNRFLLIGVKRTRYLPQGGDWRSVALRFAPMLREAMAKADACREPFALDKRAGALWDKEYCRLEERRSGDYGSMVARLSVHALKVAMAYAALDGEPLIRERHLRAALALIAHADKTASELFGGSAGTPAEPQDEEPPHAKLLNLIRSRQDGIIKRDAHRLWNNKRKATELDADFRLLEHCGFIVERNGRWSARESDTGGGVVQQSFSDGRTENGEHADERLAVACGEERRL